MGRDYADKIRGAADLAVYRADKTRKGNHTRAVQHLENAVKEWEAYTRTATSQYKPQLLSRNYYLDWEKLMEEVKKEVDQAKLEK